MKDKCKCGNTRSYEGKAWCNVCTSKLNRCAVESCINTKAGTGTCLCKHHKYKYDAKFKENATALYKAYL